MKRYDSYKYSGVEWIGEIPIHWEKKRLKHITKSINGYSFKSDDFDREFDIPVIRIGDVGDEIDFENCVKVKPNFLEEKKEFRVIKDDILIGLTGGTIGKSGKYNYDFPSLLNQRVGLLRNKESVLNGLLYHYVKSQVFIRYIFFDCYGGGQDNISMNDILNMVFPYPPLSEQQQIVSFLDTKTSLIDSLIEKTQRKIELLKEKRTSLINEVVTKGLNPNVEMKDSGVEWIGEIPSHWRTIKTNLITENLDGKRIPLNSEERGDIKGDIPYWGSGGIVDHINKYIFDEELLLVGEDGSPFFDSFRDVSFFVNEKIWVNNHIHILRSKKEIINTKYLVNSFNCVDYKEYITGSTRDKLTQMDLNRIIHPIPPLSEQQQIVSYLDEQTQLIDKTISIEEKRIELLKEYRQSLISEVVTGKRKVV